LGARVLRHSLLAGLTAFATTLGACGGGAPAARAPESMVDPVIDPGSVEEAQEQIARARSLITREAAARPVNTEVTPPLKAPPAPEPAPGRQPTEAGKAPKGAPEEAMCSRPCRALASMRRAVTALCRMTGETDERCADARRTLTDSEGRVGQCTC